MTVGGAGMPGTCRDDGGGGGHDGGGVGMLERARGCRGRRMTGCTLTTTHIKSRYEEGLLLSARRGRISNGAILLCG